MKSRVLVGDAVRLKSRLWVTAAWDLVTGWKRLEEEDWRRVYPGEAAKVVASSVKGKRVLLELETGERGWIDAVRLERQRLQLGLAVTS